MPNPYTLRVMWRDTLTRKNLQVSDLDAATQALISTYEINELAYQAKVTAWETAKATVETLSKELITERSSFMSSDAEINRAIFIHGNQPNIPNPVIPNP